MIGLAEVVVDILEQNFKAHFDIVGFFVDIFVRPVLQLLEQWEIHIVHGWVGYALSCSPVKLLGKVLELGRMLSRLLNTLVR